MTNTFIESLPKELPVDGITNHKTYRPPEHYHIVYKYETNVEGAVYIGSTNGSIRDRRGKNGRNYIGGGATKQETKFGEFLILNGWKSITSEKVIRIVREDCTPIIEQEEIDKHDAIALGFNSYRVVKETAEKSRIYSVIAGKGCDKNRPTEIGVENFQLTISHKNGSESLITMNKGFYRHYFEDIILGSTLAEEIDEEKKAIRLLDSGVEKAERYYNLENLTDIDMVRFNVDGLTENAIEFGEWVPAMDSYIGVEGLQEETYTGKSGDTYTLRRRKFIGEYM